MEALSDLRAYLGPNMYFVFVILIFLIFSFGGMLKNINMFLDAWRKYQEISDSRNIRLKDIAERSVRSIKSNSLDNESIYQWRMHDNYIPLREGDVVSLLAELIGFQLINSVHRMHEVLSRHWRILFDSTIVKVSMVLFVIHTCSIVIALILIFSEKQSVLLVCVTVMLLVILMFVRVQHKATCLERRKWHITKKMVHEFLKVHAVVLQKRRSLLGLNTINESDLEAATKEYDELGGEMDEILYRLEKALEGQRLSYSFKTYLRLLFTKFYDSESVPKA